MAEKVERVLEVGEVSLEAAPAAQARPIGQQTPFRILVMGDFSGGADSRPTCTGAELAARRPRQVHRGNFDEVLRQFEVELTSVVAAGDGPPAAISIRDLEDFEPDRLLERVEQLSALWETRGRLLNRSTFEEAAEEVRAWSGGSERRPSPAKEPPAAPAETPSPPRPPRPGGSLDLGQLLSEAVEETQPSRDERNEERAQERDHEVTPAFVDMQALAAEIVAPYRLERADPAQAELVACVEDVIAAALRSLLHHPRFQRLEAAWRSVHFLVKRLETDPTLQVHLLDVSKADLVADLTSAQSFASSGLYRLLVEQSVGTPGGEPWSVLVGDYSFDATLEDALLAGGLATIATAAGAPFVASASPRLLGCASLTETPDPDDWQQPIDESIRRAWANVRNLNVAAYLGLALPRFMLRQPYGPESSPIDAFAFQELERDEHEAHLWGNPAFAVACLLGQTFSQAGWSMQPGMIDELDGLPLSMRAHDGRVEAEPCTETLLTHRAVEAIAGAGIMPLVSLKDQDKVRLARFCSFAADGGMLSGPWKR